MRAARHVVVACTVGVLIGATPALAATATQGTSTLALGGVAAQALRTQGVRITALQPASRSGFRLALPIAGGRVAQAATLEHRGAIRLRATAAGRVRTLTLRAPRVRLGTRSTTLSAIVGGRRTTILTAAATARARLDASARTARLAATPVELTRAGGTAIRRVLGLRRAVRGRLGTLAVDAALRAAGPVALERPASAVDVTGASVLWHVRDSFIRYVNAGEGTSTSRGATAEAPTTEPGSDAPLVYAFRFRFADGWYDPAGGSARLTYTGSVRFRYAGHGIDLVASDPEIELAGARSRAIMRFTGASGAKGATRRAVLVNLDPAKATATTSPDGRTRTFEQMPGRIPAGTGASVFAGYYMPGDPFGWISTSFGASALGGTTR